MEDTFTSTVDGAAGFERYRASLEPKNEPTLRELAWEDRDDNDEEEEEEYYDKCGCSDPSCPCSGRKSGGY